MPMPLKEHLPPTLHNAAGTIIATVVLAAAGGLYFWLRGIGSISLPIWFLALVSVVILGAFAWLILRLRAYARAIGLVLHSATWGCENRVVDVVHILRSKIHDGTLIVRATNDALGSDPCPGTGKFLSVEYSWRGRPMSRSVPEPQTLSIP
jgi:hypothetical protein